jgi:hypothetical protein
LTAPTTSNFGSSVSLKATVTALAPGFGTPAGTVTFYDGSAGHYRHRHFRSHWVARGKPVVHCELRGEPELRC